MLLPLDEIVEFGIIDPGDLGIARILSGKHVGAIRGQRLDPRVTDLMARWTNNRWISSMHRVVKPGAEIGGASRRQSMVFFMNTNYDAEIECIPTCLAAGEEAKYDSVRSGDYLKVRFTSALNPE